MNNEELVDLLPAPDGTFALALRIYWPNREVLDGLWCVRNPQPVE